MDFAEANEIIQGQISLLHPTIRACLETGPARFAYDAAMRILLTCREPDTATFGPLAADDLLHGSYRALQLIVGAAEAVHNGTLMDRLLETKPRNLRPPQDAGILPFLPGTVSFEHGGRWLVGLAYRPVIDPAHPPTPAELDAELRLRGLASPTADELLALLSAIEYRTPGTYASAMAVPFTAPDIDPGFQATGYPHVRVKAGTVFGPGSTLEPATLRTLSLDFLAGVMDLEAVETARKKKARFIEEASELPAAPEPVVP